MTMKLISYRNCDLKQCEIVSSDFSYFRNPVNLFVKPKYIEYVETIIIHSAMYNGNSFVTELEYTPQ